MGTVGSVSHASSVSSIISSSYHTEFLFCRVFNIRCIIDLHAAPGSQNGMEHSASRDGSVDWPSPEYISQSLDAIEFLSARYILMVINSHNAQIRSNISLHATFKIMIMMYLDQNKKLRACLRSILLCFLFFIYFLKIYLFIVFFNVF